MSSYELFVIMFFIIFTPIYLVGHTFFIMPKWFDKINDRLMATEYLTKELILLVRELKLLQEKDKDKS